MDGNSRGIILFADNDAGILEIYQKIFERDLPNYPVEFFSDGNSLKKRLEGLVNGTDRIKIVITDNQMPGVSGREIIAKYSGKKESENIYFILFSVCSNDIAREVEDKYGAKYLPKNVDIDYFMGFIKQTLGEGI